MNWEEIVEKQAKEYKDHLNGVHDNQNKQNEEKSKLMQHHKCSKEAELPEPIRAVLNSSREGFQNEWGMYGSRFKALRIKQQKEIDNYFRQRGVVQDLSKKPNDKNKEPER